MPKEKRYYRIVLRHGRGKFATQTSFMETPKQTLKTYKVWQEIYGKKEPAIETFKGKEPLHRIEVSKLRKLS